MNGPVERKPPGVVVESLGRREYKYSAPGMREPLRVTTDPDYFDAHASSVELWSPGSPLFPELPPATTASESAAIRRSLSDLIRTVSDGEVSPTLL